MYLNVDICNINVYVTLFGSKGWYHDFMGVLLGSHVAKWSLNYTK